MCVFSLQFSVVSGRVCVGLVWFIISLEAVCLSLALPHPHRTMDSSRHSTFSSSPAFRSPFHHRPWMNQSGAAAAGGGGNIGLKGIVAGKEHERKRDIFKGCMKVKISGILRSFTSKSDTVHSLINICILPRHACFWILRYFPCMLYLLPKEFSKLKFKCPHKTTVKYVFFFFF